MDHTEEQVNAGVDFAELQREYWERQLREFPELSTWTGDNILDLLERDIEGWIEEQKL